MLLGDTLDGGRVLFDNFHPLIAEVKEMVNLFQYV